MPDTVAHLNEAETPEQENQLSPVNPGLMEEIQTFYYHDDLDYLEDIRLLLIEKSKAKPGMAGIRFESPEIREIKSQINHRLERTRNNGIELRIDRPYSKSLLGTPLEARLTETALKFTS